MFKVVESTGIYDSLDPLQKEYKNILKSGFSNIFSIIYYQCKSRKRVSGGKKRRFLF